MSVILALETFKLRTPSNITDPTRYLQVHWHSYHILCDVDTYVLISGKKGAPLRQKPLNPIIVTLPTNFDLIYK